MKKHLLILVAVSITVMLTIPGFAEDNLLRIAQGMFKPIPQDPPTLRNNPLTPEKIELGKMLYFDPRLSASALISCNTCHNLGLGGADFQETSVGHGWQKGPRNSPTVFNAVFNTAQFWDGRALDLKEQSKGPVQASVEMNNTPDQVVNTLKSMPGYIAIFTKVFPDEPDPVTFDNMARAIEAFEATLLTPDAAFDQYLNGNQEALTANEKKGLQLFIRKGCGACHSGVNMGGTGYFPFGVVERPKEEITAGDLGRYKLTGATADQYVFKSPSLRNLTLTAPYFHSGKVWSLNAAVSIMGSAQLGIPLSAEDATAITTFLTTTTGKQPPCDYPILPAPTDTTPQPRIN